jgi:hypothetical protein
MFALGPTARLLGERVLYKAPYSWLMLLPGFYDEFRVPARFAMLAALTLSAAAAVAFWRLFAGRAARLRTVAACIVTIGILFDSWIAPFPLASAPPALLVPATVPEDAAILELPVGVFEDATAMYHATLHRRRTVNGMSGYEPAHYSVLRSALDERRLEVIGELAAFGELAVFIRRDGHAGDVATLLARTAAKQVSETETHHVLLLPAAPPVTVDAVAARALVPAYRLASHTNPPHLALMSDGDRTSTWTTPAGQRGGEEFTADLGEVIPIVGITLAGGKSMTAFPRAIAIAVSADGLRWTPVWQGDAAAKTVAAAIADPRTVAVPFGFSQQSARYVRVTQTGQSAQPWAVAEFRAVRAAPE